MANLGLVQRFGIYGMRSLSTTGAIMYPFEPKFSLQDAFHDKSDFSVFSNGAFEEIEKADFLIEGDSWWYEVQSVDISHQPV